MTTLGSEVKRLRESRGLTQAQLAAQSHLGMNFIWGIERDRDVQCSYWQIERLARALGVPEGSLLPLIPPERRRIRRGGDAA